MRRDLDVFVADGFNDVLFVGGTDRVLHNNIDYEKDESDTDENGSKWRVVRDGFFRADKRVES